MTFETAQEKLLSIKQGPEENLSEYANRVKNLLEILNATTTNECVEIQSANRVMNECLAIRKFQQNIFDKNIQLMALSSSHNTLNDAISHAIEKQEQLNSSNVEQNLEKPTVKTESEGSDDDETSVESYKSSNETEDEVGENGEQLKEEVSNTKTPCTYCKKTNHQSSRCFFRP